MTGLKKMTCAQCKGEMEPYTGPKYSRKMGGFLIGAGAFATLFWIGAVLGVPLILIGGYMVGAKRQLWVCKECSTAIERIELAPSKERKDAAN